MAFPFLPSLKFYFTLMAVLQDWSKVCSKGSFFIDMDGLITSHEYELQIPRDSDVFISIYPIGNKKGTCRVKYFAFVCCWHFTLH